MYKLNQIKLELIRESVQRLTDVSDEDYFGEAYKDYVSNSTLKLINPAEGGTPQKFLSGFKDKKQSDALDLGTAVHQMTLEKDKYYVSDVEKPSGKVGEVIDRYFAYTSNGMEDKEAIILACQESDYYKNNLTDVRIANVLKAGEVYLSHLVDSHACTGCITLTSEMKGKLDNCLESIQGNPLAVEALTPPGVVYNEDVLIMDAVATMPSPDEDSFEDVEVNIKLKAKIDCWAVDVENKVLTLVDLKTTGNGVNNFNSTTYEQLGLDGDLYVRKNEGSFQKFRYYRQMALYSEMLQAYAEQTYGFDESWTYNIQMVVVETTPPHLSHVFTVTQPWLNIGTVEYTSLLRRVAFHKVHGWDNFVDLDRRKITEI